MSRRTLTELGVSWRSRKRRATRSSMRLAALGSVVLAAIASAAAALASSSGPVAHTAATVSDLTGYWRNRVDPASYPAWQLAASNSLQILDASWRGAAASGHPNLRGTFHGTLTQVGGADAYVGRFRVTEEGTVVSGAMTWKIDSPDQCEVYIQPDNGSTSHYVFIRVGPPPPVVAPTPSAFDQTVTAPEPPPGGEAIVASPALAAFGVVSAGIQGVSAQDVAVVPARHKCFVTFTKNLFEHISRYPPSDRQEAIDDFTTDFVSYQLQGATRSYAFKDLAVCLALVDALEAVTPNLTVADIARSSCGPIRPITLTLTGSGSRTRLRSFKVGNANDKHEAVRANCARSGATLSMSLTTRSRHTALRTVFGSNLALGIVRHHKDAGGGQLMIAFHHR